MRHKDTKMSKTFQELQHDLSSFKSFAKIHKNDSFYISSLIKPFFDINKIHVFLSL